MAIYKKGKSRIKNDPPVADTSYQSDVLAQMIVYAWADKAFRDKLLERKDGKAPFVKQALAERGFYLDNPVVIPESEYDADYTMKNDNEVVFVLPDSARVANAAQGDTLLDTAKLLMACVPNGI
jgi:hypothetical protein